MTVHLLAEVAWCQLITGIRQALEEAGNRKGVLDGVMCERDAEILEHAAKEVRRLIGKPKEKKPRKWKTGNEPAYLVGAEEVHAFAGGDHAVESCEDQERG